MMNNKQHDQDSDWPDDTQSEAKQAVHIPSAPASLALAEAAIDETESDECIGRHDNGNQH